MSNLINHNKGLRAENRELYELLGKASMLFVGHALTGPGQVEWEIVNALEKYRKTEEQEQAIEAEARLMADKIHEWLYQQKYAGEPILHPIVCCDWVSIERFKKGIARILLGEKDPFK